MKKVFAYDSYKELILNRVSEFPDKGRGIMRRLSDHMRVHPSFISQVLKGDKHFSLEQIYTLANFFSMKPLERDFLLALLQLERAGTHELKSYFSTVLSNIRKKSKYVSKQFQKKTILSEQDQARFYSDWIYSGIRLFCMRNDVTLDLICERFNLESQKALEVTSFLLEVGLLTKAGAYFKTGVTHTHLPANSPFIVSHHKNWRIKSIEKHARLSDEELAFTAPFCASKEDFALIKEEILNLIARTSARVRESSSDELACLNIDLFFL